MTAALPCWCSLSSFSSPLFPFIIYSVHIRWPLVGGEIIHPVNSCWIYRSYKTGHTSVWWCAYPQPYSRVATRSRDLAYLCWISPQPRVVFDWKVSGFADVGFHSRFCLTDYDWCLTLIFLSSYTDVNVEIRKSNGTVNASERSVHYDTYDTVFMVI